MISLPPSVKIFLATQPADMRRSFDGLAAMVEHVLQQDPLSGHLFVFRNRRGDRVKLLYWDRDGLCIWYKRLEEGTFRFPAPQEGQTCVTISAAEWAMLLDGVDFTNVRRVKRYRRTA
jgi:transposase